MEEKVYRNRGVGVVTLVMTFIGGKAHILANQRGDKTSEQGLLWNLPSGYLDWNETAEMAAVREIKEECGVEIAPSELTELEHSTDPAENRQNIMFRYIAVVEPERLRDFKAMDADEVRDIRLIPLSDIEQYRWAWGQNRKIYRLINKYNEYAEKKVMTFGKHKGEVIDEAFTSQNWAYLEWANKNVEEVAKWFKNGLKKPRTAYTPKPAPSISRYYGSGHGYGDDDDDENRRCGNCPHGGYDSCSDYCDACRHDPDTGWGGETDHSLCSDSEETGWGGD
jgi:ADP-ribose pyrophosphatase YjhB (NUDIX family)